MCRIAARAFEFRSSQEGICSFSSFSCFVKLEMRLISSGEEREARAVFSWEISNLESAVCFAFSSSANFQVQQQKAVAAPWLLRNLEGKPNLRTKFTFSRSFRLFQEP